jgi:hypothetical protein
VCVLALCLGVCSGIRDTNFRKIRKAFRFAGVTLLSN